MKGRHSHTPVQSLAYWLIHQWAGSGYVAFFFLVLLVVTLLVLGFALAFFAASPSDTVFGSCVQRAFLSFVTLSSSSRQCVGRLPVLDTVLESILLLVALFFFAAVVAYFTALVLRPKKLFRFKSTLNIRRDRAGDNRVVCSIYAAPVTVTNLNIRIIARVRLNEHTIRNVLVRNGPPRHPLAEPYIPLRIGADLNEAGIHIDAVDAKGQVTRMVHRDTSSGSLREVEEFYVDITGVMGRVEQSVFGEHWYRIADGDVFCGPFASVDPDYRLARSCSSWRKRRPPSSVRETFHMNGEPDLPSTDTCHIFGYGSLMDPDSFARTLEREEWSVEDFPIATLIGFRRIWNVAMDNRVTIPGYKQYYLADTDTCPEVLVGFLNIEPSAEDEVIGVLARVEADELSRLVKRERNYQLVEITAQLMSGSCDGKVYTFVGKEEAVQRLAAGRAAGQAVVSESYHACVLRAARLRGREVLDNCRAHPGVVEAGGLPRMKLTSRPVPDKD